MANDYTFRFGRNRSCMEAVGQYCHL